MKHFLNNYKDGRPYHCDSCGKAFKSLRELKQIKISNKVERRYECDVCNKIATGTNSLQTHRQIMSLSVVSTL